MRWEYLHLLANGQQCEVPTGEFDGRGRPRMKLEWRFVTLYHGVEIFVDDALAASGEEGWELVSALPSDGTGTAHFYLKRPKT